MHEILFKNENPTVKCELEVTIPLSWFEHMVENETKYRTLKNYLFSQASLRDDGSLSIYTNAADILQALEKDECNWKIICMEDKGIANE